MIDSDLDFLGDSETGTLARSFDWSRTSVGPIPCWPQSLKTAVSMILRSPVAIVLLWGADGVMIYNDAYAGFAGNRHPSLFGSKVREGWPEVADFNDNAMKVGLSGSTLSYRDQELTLCRNGIPEQVWMNLDYSPVLDDGGHPAGVLAVVVETTDRVLAERALSKAEERLSYALNASGMVGTFDWHIPSDTFYSDARFAAMFSLDPDRGEKGAPLSDYVAGIHPEDVDRIAKAVERSLETGEKYVQEYRLLQKEGTVRWIEARGECLYDNEGKPLRFPGVVVDITEPKRAEQAARESEERFRAVFEQTTGGIALTDRTGRFVLVNQRYCAILGYSQDELLGKRMQEITHPDDLPVTVAAFRRLIEDGTSFEIEKRYVRKDGSLVWVNISVGAVRDAAGRTQQVVGMATDITERKRAEDALRRLAAIIESSDDGVIGMDLDATITSWNRGAERLYGYRAEEVIGEPVMLLLPEGRKAEEPQILERMSRGERVDHYETVRRRKDGSLVEISLTVSPVRDGQGRIIGASKVARDITERKRAEKALRESQRHLSAVLNNASVAIFRMDDRQQCVYMNPAAEKLTGYTLAEVTGRPLHDIIHHTRPDGSRYPLEECPIDQAFPESNQMQGEEVFVHKDGSFYPVAFTASPIRDETGEPVGTIVEVRDIRAEKEAQERQRLLLRELNHRVKNLFAIASGMVTLSARSTRTPQEMAQVLHGRLSALARANDLIRPGLVGTEEGQETTTMLELVQAILLPYVDERRARDQECVVLDGPAVPIGGGAVTSLALALHETATNAAKYGALSAPPGCLRVEWCVAGADLHLHWKETGGPAVSEPPMGTGFGSSLVKRSITGQLRGSVEYDWQPDGLMVRITAPLERLNP